MKLTSIFAAASAASGSEWDVSQCQKDISGKIHSTSVCQQFCTHYSEPKMVQACKDGGYTDLVSCVALESQGMCGGETVTQPTCYVEVEETTKPEVQVEWNQADCISGIVSANGEDDTQCTELCELYGSPNFESTCISMGATDSLSCAVLNSFGTCKTKVNNELVEVVPEVDDSVVPEGPTTWSPEECVNNIAATDGGDDYQCKDLCLLYGGAGLESTCISMGATNPLACAIKNSFGTCTEKPVIPETESSESDWDVDVCKTYITGVSSDDNDRCSALCEEFSAPEMKEPCETVGQFSGLECAIANSFGVCDIKPVAPMPTLKPITDGGVVAECPLNTSGWTFEECISQLGVSADSVCGMQCSVMANMMSYDVCLYAGQQSIADCVKHFSAGNC